MSLYLLRAVRYILRMVILLGIVFAILYFTNMLDTGGDSLLRALFLSRKGVILIAALLVLALLYPKMSFAKIDVRADITGDRAAIIEAFRSYNYSLAKERGGVMVFRADSIAKRILSSWDDAITVTGEGAYIALEGMKKDLPRVELRINSMLGR